ncbi:WAS/WASL-interacting protein family member 1-like [Penaeus indicus]|uniref:WAS/WASL-interacting protein family member 1-like n=1 Tax=Penaeus indicus TaxID=29960 RepID=UPI00300C0CCE
MAVAVGRPGRRLPPAVTVGWRQGFELAVAAVGLWRQEGRGTAAAAASPGGGGRQSGRAPPPPPAARRRPPSPGRGGVGGKGSSCCAGRWTKLSSEEPKDSSPPSLNAKPTPSHPGLGRPRTAAVPCLPFASTDQTAATAINALDISSILLARQPTVHRPGKACGWQAGALPACPPPPDQTAATARSDPLLANHTPRRGRRRAGGRLVPAPAQQTNCGHRQLDPLPHLTTPPRPGKAAAVGTVAMPACLQRTTEDTASAIPCRQPTAHRPGRRRRRSVLPCLDASTDQLRPQPARHPLPPTTRPAGEGGGGGRVAMPACSQRQTAATASARTPAQRRERSGGSGAHGHAQRDAYGAAASPRARLPFSQSAGQEPAAPHI